MTLPINTDYIYMDVSFDDQVWYTLTIGRVGTTNHWEWSLDNNEWGTIYNHEGSSLDLIGRILNGRDMSGKTST